MKFQMDFVRLDIKPTMLLILAHGGFFSELPEIYVIKLGSFLQ